MKHRPAGGPDGLAIRKLRHEDLERFFKPADIANGRKWLQLQDRNFMYVAVAEVHGVAVGRSCLMYNYMGDPPNAYSFASSVSPQWRSRGIGTAMIEHVEREARARGMYRITAHTATTNPRAAKWRERMGYRRVCEENIHWTEADGRRVDSLSWKFERSFPAPASYRFKRWVRRRVSSLRRRIGGFRRGKAG
jgi:GNAT superfamily N-acetyltransferase